MKTLTCLFILCLTFTLSLKNKLKSSTRFCDEAAHQYCDGGMVCRWYSCYSPYKTFECLKDVDCPADKYCDMGTCNANEDDY
jgi:hypothetical protein